VVSTKMQKTIVVEVEMRKAHAKYKRIVRSTKKFYAHDEQSSARMGDVVRIRETRPLSKLKRWSLEEIVRRSTLARLKTRQRPRRQPQPSNASDKEKEPMAVQMRTMLAVADNSGARQAASDSAPGRGTGQEGRPG